MQSPIRWLKAFALGLCLLASPLFIGCQSPPTLFSSQKLPPQSEPDLAELDPASTRF